MSMLDNKKAPVKTSQEEIYKQINEIYYLLGDLRGRIDNIERLQKAVKASE